jgi:hypothetical protein
LINDGRVGAPSTRTWVVAVAVIFAALLVGLQVAALRLHLQGPLGSLASDYVATPKSPEVLWAGLGLAMVGLSNRHRIIALSVAAAVDVAFFAARALLGGTLALGNGALIVLTGLALVVWWRWTGTERTVAFGGIALGALLIVATKIGYSWLEITAVARPKVLDVYVMLADHALGQPSWLVGRFIDAAGPIAHGVVHLVYIELAVAAMVVALYQLRNVRTDGWPRHFVVRTFIILGLIGPLLYVLFPVVGPVYAFGHEGHGFEVGNLWPQVMPPTSGVPAPIVFDGYTPRNCMPSMHTAWALAVFIHSRRGPRWLRWGGAFWLVGTLTATLGFGYHYGVDLVAGAVLCLAVESALRDPQRGWDRQRALLVFSGALLLTSLLMCFRYLAVPMAHLPEVFGPLILGLLVAYAFSFYRVFFAGLPIAPSSPVKLKTDT